MGATKHDSYTPEQNSLAALFKALGHPARIAIVQQLLSEDCCICRDFTAEIDLSQPTVSRHLMELKRAGLIAGTVSGNQVSYCLSPGRWQDLHNALNGMLPAADDTV